MARMSDDRLLAARLTTSSTHAYVVSTSASSATSHSRPIDHVLNGPPFGAARTWAECRGPGRSTVLAWGRVPPVGCMLTEELAAPDGVADVGEAVASACCAPAIAGASGKAACVMT